MTDFFDQDADIKEFRPILLCSQCHLEPVRHEQASSCYDCAEADGTLTLELLDEEAMATEKDDDEPEMTLSLFEAGVDTDMEDDESVLEDDDGFSEDDEDQYWLTPLQRFERKLLRENLA
jgi:hypothetical protein